VIKCPNCYNKVKELTYFDHSGDVKFCHPCAISAMSYEIRRALDSMDDLLEEFRKMNDVQ